MKDKEALDAMIRYGNSFERTLGFLCYKANIQAYSKLRNSFDDLFRKYKNIAQTHDVA